MTLNLIKRLKTIVYNTSHTNNSKLHVQYYFFENTCLPKRNISLKKSIHVREPTRDPKAVEDDYVLSLITFNQIIYIYIYIYT